MHQYNRIISKPNNLKNQLKLCKEKIAFKILIIIIVILIRIKSLNTD